MPLYSVGTISVLMSKNIASLVVDTHENKRIKSCREYFEKKDIKVTRERLDFGDYVFDGKVCFEFKTWEDFISSMDNGSLFEEVYNQADYYDYPYLIICGDRDDVVGSYFYRNYAMRVRFRSVRKYFAFINQAVDGAIRRCRVVCNVITVPTLDDAWHEMFEQSDKCLSSRKYGGTVRKRNVKLNTPIDHFIWGIRGFGEKTVDEFMDVFEPNSLHDLFNVSGDDMVREGFRMDAVKNYCKYVHGEDYVQDKSEQE